MHLGVCKAGSNVCYNCGQAGHYSSHCPSKQQGMARGKPDQSSAQPLRAIMGYPQPPQQQRQPQGPQKHQKQQQQQQQLPQHQRAFALNEKQPEKNQGNLTGMGKILDVPVIVLFDTGASHSFVAQACVNTFKLEPKLATPELRVITPVGFITSRSISAFSHASCSYPSSDDSSPPNQSRNQNPTMRTQTTRSNSDASSSSASSSCSSSSSSSPPRRLELWERGGEEGAVRFDSGMGRRLEEGLRRAVVVDVAVT
ncbi:uncharacterized protein LOC130990663 [Salvia miltiorrhiza]|uniref:uncharacterized protein LOC130990663 n=1 Tax=Salvia miltiorrhiza TaxID=226208 RepID=UPI0025ACE831|nr:uncharacterized protein LOC130990663 [Salvia miltiorrhiza]